MLEFDLLTAETIAYSSYVNEMFTTPVNRMNPGIHLATGDKLVSSTHLTTSAQPLARKLALLAIFILNKIV